VTSAAQRRGFNDAITRFWGFAAPAYNLPFLQQWVYRRRTTKWLVSYARTPPRA
jgi:hypothetical protein